MEWCRLIGEGEPSVGKGFFGEERTGVVGTFATAGGDRQAFLQGFKAGSALADRFPNAAFTHGIAETNQHAHLQSLLELSMPE
jgi:hypothetical protein